MPRPTEYPVYTCKDPDCAATWIHDPIMYEDPSLCPKCGRHCDRGQVFGEDIDDVDWIGGGTSQVRLWLSYQTAGPMRFTDGNPIQTRGTHDAALYRT